VRPAPSGAKPSKPEARAVRRALRRDARCLDGPERINVQGRWYEAPSVLDPVQDFTNEVEAIAGRRIAPDALALFRLATHLGTAMASAKGLRPDPPVRWAGLAAMASHVVRQKETIWAAGGITDANSPLAQALSALEVALGPWQG
jgi:hypothetical protein